MTAPVFARVTDVFEPIVLRRAERVARGYTDAQGESVRRLARGARDRVVAARELTGGRSQVGAFALLREAGALATSAVIAARTPDGSAPLSPSRAHEQLVALIESGALPAFPTAIAAVARSLGADDPLSADSLPASDLPGATAFVLWLLDRVEERSVDELRARRLTRIIGLVSAVAIALIAGLFLAATAKDLARNGHVTASSVRPGFDAGSAVDGKTDGDTGFESIVEDDPWLEVDLGDHFQLDSIVVLDREGGRKSTLSRRLSISDDGSTWQAVGSSPASTVGFWSVPLNRPWARYVKLDLDGHGALSVGELKVYGR